MAIEHHDYDVLVLGSGGSGLRAAIAAAEAGAKTGLVCKSLLGKAHTVMAEGGLAAALGNVAPEDSWSTHFQDTMFGGKYLNNWRMAELHAKEAPDRARELEQWGAVFDRTPERVMSQRAFGGHTYRRLVHIGDRTGLEMIRTLQDRTVHADVEIFMETTITQLIKDGDRVVGCFGYRRQTGEQISFSAKALVLATGGSGRIYKITSNSQDCTGDGYALAYAAGAELVDMEFVQFHPTGMVFPPGVAGLLVTEAVRGEGGILRNKDGERFMERYDPKRMELSTRDVVARSIYTEVKEGRGTPHGGAFLDVSHLDSDYVKRKLPSMYDQFLELAGVDITKEPMQVGPTCHYFMGGIKVDADDGQTRVPGLFATGEASGGMNGANRLGGNSLGDLLVFGRRAGIGAAQAANRSEPVSLPADEIAAAQADVEHHPQRLGNREPIPDAQGAAEDHGRRGRDLPRPGGPLGGDRQARAARGPRRQPQGSIGSPGLQPGLAALRRGAEHAHGLADDRPRRADARGEPRRSQPPRSHRVQRLLGGEQHRDPRGRLGRHGAHAHSGREARRTGGAGRGPEGG